MPGPELVVKFLGDVSGLEHASAKAEGATEKTTSKMSKLGMVAGGAAAVGIGIAAEALGKSVEAAEKDQVATERMEQAFKSAHVALGPMKDSIEAATSSAGKLGFTQEQVKSSLGALVIATHNGKSAVSDLTAAEDIARFKHIDLTAATKMLVMAQTGSQRATKQLGIEIQAVTTHQDKLKLSYQASVATLKAGFPTLSKMTQAQRDQYDAKKNTLDLNYNLDKSEAKIQDHQITGARVINEVTQKLHGQADAYANTAAGAKERLGVALDDLEVKVGKKLLPVMTKITLVLANDLPKAMDYLSRFWKQHGDQIMAVMDAIGHVVQTTFTLIKDIIDTISDLIHGRWSKLWDDLVGIVTTAGALLHDAIQYQINAIEAIFGGLIKSVSDAADQVVGFFAALPGRIAATLGDLVSTAMTPLETKFTDTKKAVSSKVDDIVGFFTKMPGRIAATLGDLAKTALSPFEAAFDDAKGVAFVVSGHVDKIVGFFTGLPGRIAATIGGLGKTALVPFAAAFDDAKGLAHTISGYVNKIVGYFTALPGKLVGALNDKALQPLIAAFGKVGTAMSDALKAPINAVIKMIDSIAIPGFHVHIGMPSPVPDIDFGYGGSGALFNLPTLDAGGFVAQTGVAVVHRGEEFLGVGAARRGAGGDVHVHLDNAMVIGTDLRKAGEQLADPIRRALLKQQARTGLPAFG
jgi:phage-related protein